MKAFNKTRKTLLAENIVIPTSLMEQTVGLLKYKTPTAMLLKTRFGIHTLDMRYAIDVLILDKQNRVAALKENLQPNRIFVWNPKYHTILELPPGTIKKTKTKKGDQINFNDK
jgi:uncharacterized membrane protein (UPF0127 family)